MIQSAFGRHDVSSISAHQDGAAQEGAAQLGASAFAVGNSVAFAAPPDLHTAAHEAAHVVQQRAGVRPPGGIDHVGDVHERQADQIADAVVSGGSAEPMLDRVAAAGAATSATPAVQRVPDPFIVALEAKLTAGNMAGFYGDIAGLNAARAGDAALRTAFSTWRTAGKLFWKQAFRAVAFQEYGPQASWPLPVKNFADGVDAGTYPIAALPPAGADALREYCVKTSSTKADGAADVRTQYRTEFNSRFDSSRFAGKSTDLDPSATSKGPRTFRSHAIFNELYAMPPFKAAYDTDTPAGFRELCDTFAGPDGTNLIASPRLDALRATLAGAVVNAASTAAPAYTALVAAVTPVATRLDARDRQELSRMHSWRLAVDNKVSGPTPAVSLELRDDLWSVVTTSRAAGPAALGPAGPAEAPPPAPVPNAAQTAFLSAITLTAPASPSNATLAEHPLKFDIRGPANPALAVKRRIVIEPAAQVSDGQTDEAPWPNGAVAADHTAHVDPQPTGGPSTTFTARLTMPPLSTVTFPEKSANVVVFDKRIDFVKANLQPGLRFVNFSDKAAVGAGATAHYTGKQCPIDVVPNLGPGNTNPGLNLQIDGELKKAGVVVNAIPRGIFGQRAAQMSLFQTIVHEPAVAPVIPEDWTLTIRLFQGAAPAVVHTIIHPFKIAKSPAGGIAADTVQMTADNTWLNGPIGTAGTLLHHMNAKGSHYARVAQGVSGGALKVRACFMRSDSADQVIAIRGAAAVTDQVAYAMGVVDPIGTADNTLVAVPGAAGWRWPAHPDTVFLNATPIPGGGHRTLDALADFLAHEGIHAADRIGPGTWERYATEFRAYWVMGTAAGSPTGFDGAMSGIGPKAPRARRIFEHLYGNSTYQFVKPAYDQNDGGFREKVDNYLMPDGINLTLSAKLTDLRSEIESFAGPGFAAKKAAVVAKYAVCAPADAHEITNNRSWRDLVESKFAVIAERNQIKDTLKIPR